jgi:hypothetical protein
LTILALAVRTKENILVIEELILISLEGTASLLLDFADDINCQAAEYVTCYLCIVEGSLRQAVKTFYEPLRNSELVIAP